MPVFRDGYELCVPTSVAKSGASSTATINAKGSVTFSLCASLSLNGVFSSTYDNYMIVVRETSTALDAIAYRMRLSGIDATTTAYTHQYLMGNGSAVSGARATAATYGVICNVSEGYDGGVCFVYGPALAQPTATRGLGVDSNASGRLIDYASTHSVATAYDGITMLATVGGNTLSGLVAVYGAVQ